jgi:phosphate-induced protein 1
VRRFQALGLLAVVTIALGILRGDDADQLSIKLPFGSDQDKGGPSGSTQILWHGGPVLEGKVPIYVIYYGTGFPATTQTIVNAFLEGLGGTDQYNVNKTYCELQTTDCADESPSTAISGALDYPLNLHHVFLDSGSQGTQISSPRVPKILQYALASATPGHLPTDDGAVYILITAPNVNVPGFCTSFCAYHTLSTSIVSGHTIHYAFVPEPGSKCTVCDGNFAVYHEADTPNDDPGADEMVDSLVHEISETVTDPNLNAWYTSSGAENGDLCNYNYASPSLTTTTVEGNTVHYNATWNGFKYLIQRIWENRALPQGCAP